ncbi:Uma2 family endonuclease [Tautonia rosea]|uniref:Uma2 family endonuclease n=1 Tax=Tautonia rosea TaxID=2728037 RepID=UPI00147488B2|nr:Uma2 family endonuclease [Tautonia rosea]
MASTSETIHLGPLDHGRRLTLQEFLDADTEEGYRYELARGFLEVTSFPGEDHGLIVWNLIHSLNDFDRNHPGLIHRAGGGGELRLPGFGSGRHPDVAVVLRNAPKDLRGVRVPSLVMEVVSPGAEARERDYTTKREEYLAFGLFEYWIVDPIDRRITVLIRDAGTWVERPFTETQTAEGLVLPGFLVPVAELFAAAADDEGQGGAAAPGA